MVITRPITDICENEKVVTTAGGFIPFHPLPLPLGPFPLFCKVMFRCRLDYGPFSHKTPKNMKKSQAICQCLGSCPANSSYLASKANSCHCLHLTALQCMNWSFYHSRPTRTTWFALRLNALTDCVCPTPDQLHCILLLCDGG